MAWYFLLILITPLGQLEIETIGPFHTQENCQSVEKVLRMKIPPNYLLIDTIPCWEGGKEHVK